MAVKSPVDANRDNSPMETRSQPSGNVTNSRRSRSRSSGAGGSGNGALSRNQLRNNSVENKDEASNGTASYATSRFEADFLNVTGRSTSHSYDTVERGAHSSSYALHDERKNNEPSLLDAVEKIDLEDGTKFDWRASVYPGAGCSSSSYHCRPGLSSNANWVQSNSPSSSTSRLAEMEVHADRRRPLEVGNLVEVSINGKPHTGVVRWLGHVEDFYPQKLIAGLEMDNDHPSFGDGTFSSEKHFQCQPNKGLFVYADECKLDPKFDDYFGGNADEVAFGGIACPRISGRVSPMNFKDGNVESICGQNKGIQGHHNSCYLDATLFSMFAFTSVFDSLLYRERMEGDIPEYGQVQSALNQAIVNPLRKNMYVRADNVLTLRYLLDKFGSVTGLTCEEKDPEEFLNSLLQQILKAKPFLKLSSGQESFYYQLFVEKNEKIEFPTVQYLLQQSFYSSSVKLQLEPSCLIILMPRFGKQYKVYPRIFPNLSLDVSEVIENVLRLCSSCGGLATMECMSCFQESSVQESHCAFCDLCVETVHHHNNRIYHKPQKLVLDPDIAPYKETVRPKAIEMKLFAVVCIETSHYVTFTKCGEADESPWCFFDSMADRSGGQNGYNIPEVMLCPDLNIWLSNDGYEELAGMSAESSQPIPDYVKRLLSDAYLCMYYSPKTSMYS